MTTPRQSPTSPAQDQPLPRLALAYLADEEAALGRQQAALRDVRDALLGRPDADLALALGRVTGEQASRLRQRFRLEAGRWLGLDPEAVTWSQLLQKMPPAAAAELAPRVEHVRRCARQLEALFREVAALARCGQEFLSRLLCDLTGGEQLDRYSRDGRPRRAACGHLLQARR